MPNPKHSTTNKRVKPAVVGIGKTTREARRNELSDTRRAQVYRTNAELFTVEQTRIGRTNPITPAELERIVYLREVENLSWVKIGSDVDRSHTGCYNAYKKYESERKTESGT